MTRTLLLILGVTWAGLGPGPSAWADLSRQEALDLFRQANQAFRTANAQTDPAVQQQLYEQAALTYQKIIEAGVIHNARLYYDLGNAYLLKGDVGKAVLNYLRAERLDNGDTNIRKNLAFARSRRPDKIVVKTEQQVLGTLLFWHYDLATRTRFLGACLSFAVLCLSLTAMVWRGRHTAAVGVAVIAAVLWVLLAGSVVVETHQQAGKVFGVITAGQVVARQGDGPNYPESFKAPLHAGTEFELIEGRPHWLHIRLSDDSEGWIPGDTAETL